VPAQSYVERLPVPELTGLVASVRVQTIAAGSQPLLHRDVPHGGFDLVCTLGTTMRVVGPQTGPTVTPLAPSSTVVALRFWPGTAAQVLGVPASRLVDLDVAAEEVIGARATEVAEWIAATGTPASAARSLQQLVLAKLGLRSDTDLAVIGIVDGLRQRLNSPVADIRSALHVSERHFRRLCREQVGFSPKALQRVLRFQRFLAYAQRNLAVRRRPQGDGLVRMAELSGYADQSHLSRECLRLTGETPATLLHQVAHSCADHDHSASYAWLTSGS
jgi:AraC-like DNA-binding protein